MTPLPAAFCLLFVLGLPPTAHCDVCSGPADNVQVCSHCTFASASCKDSASAITGVTHVTTCSANCYSDPTCSAFLYDSDAQACWNMASSCDGLAYTSGNTYVYRNTCNADCTTFTLTAYSLTKLAYSSSLYSDSDPLTEVQCIERCFDTDSCYVFSYGFYSGNYYCSNHYTCDGCMANTNSHSDNTVYVKTCKVDCGSLSSPSNGGVSVASTLEGETAVYSCEEGFSLDGPGSRTCQASGVWSGTEPTCAAVDCGSLSSISNGAVDNTDGVTYGSTATYTCDPGHTMAGIDARSCQADGSWSGSEPACNIVDCGSLSDISGGAVNTSAGVTYDSTATYMCGPGHTMAGSDTRSCQADGSWSGSEPACNIVDCGSLSDISGGAVNTSAGVTYGSTATYTCDPGHTMAGSDTRSCQADGSWSGSEPACNIVNCGSLSSISNGAVDNTDGVTYGSTATYTCDPGHTMAGIDARSCQADGSWSGSEPACNIVDCGSLSNISNGTVDNTDGVTYGSTATYTCDPGHTIAGSYTRSCQADGSWSGSEPACNIVAAITTTLPTTSTSSSTATTQPSTESTTSQAPTVAEGSTATSTASVSTTNSVPSTTARPAQLFIRPCLCGNNSFAGMTQEEIIEQLVADIKIDTKNTSLARNKLMCMYDGRASSAMIGIVGVVFMVVVFGGMLVLDLISLFRNRHVCFVHRRAKRTS